MRNRIIIGLTGKARSGKDTVGQFLAQNHGYTRAAFGDKLKEAAYALNPIIKPLIYGSLTLQEIVDRYGWEHAKDHYPEVRRILQALGTEAGWQIHGKNLWVRALEHAIADLPNTAPIVITDVRYQHEADWIKLHWGVIIDVRRPNSDDALTGDAATHSSEQAEITPDHIIVNDGTLDQLQARTLSYAQHMYGVPLPKEAHA